MEGALKVLMLAALILLATAQTFNNYRSLPALYRKHIDKALKKANSNSGRSHVAFHSLKGKQNTMASSLYVNVLLIVTKCEKASSDAYEHRDDCVTRKDKTPMIDCVVCKTKDDKELVDCGTKYAVENKMQDTFRNKCKLYHTGGGIAFRTSEDHEKKIGCLGCI